MRFLHPACHDTGKAVGFCQGSFIKESDFFKDNAENQADYQHVDIAAGYAGEPLGETCDDGKLCDKIVWSIVIFQRFGKNYF